MASKRDQLQAYQFLVQRVVSALITRETDPEQPPFRRPGVAAIGSIVLAVLILAGFGVFGLLVPGGKTAWQDGKSVILEKETGTRFVYLNGRLHPVMNFASALLALGNNAEVKRVSRRSLADTPRGPMIGIPGAPDSLPDRKQLLGGGWSMCSEPVPDATGSMVDESVLMVGTGPAGGRQVGDSAVLVREQESQNQYLIWRGHRHLVRRSEASIVIPALQSVPWATIGAEVLDALPAGDPITPIRLPKIGAVSQAIPGYRGLKIGMLLYSDTSGGRQHYLVERARLRPISPLQHDIQRSFGPTAEAYGGRQPTGVPIGLLAIGKARIAGVPPEVPGRMPRRRPAFVGTRGDGSALCATYRPGAAIPTLGVDGGLPDPDPMTATAGRAGQGIPLADRVVVPPGTAALVEAMPSATAPSGAIGIVTDLGIHHPVPAAQTLNAFGYGDAPRVRLPAGLVARIPNASALDHDAALRQVAGPTTR